jgi:hypothetical protein
MPVRRLKKRFANFVNPLVIEQGRSCLPGKENAAIYKRIYPLYQKLYRSESGNFEDIARLQQDLGA